MYTYRDCLTACVCVDVCLPVQVGGERETEIPPTTRCSFDLQMGGWSKQVPLSLLHLFT